MSQLKPDLEQAQQHLSLLAPTTSNFLFMAIDDDQDRKNPPRVFYGSLAEHAPTLTALNNQGYGIFVCINETDNGGRLQ